MERLTKRVVGGVCHYDCSDSCSSCCGCECFDVWKMLDKLAAYEDTGLEPSDVPTALEMANVFCAMEKLKAYEDAEEQGRLVVLPCNPVWFIVDKGTEFADVYSRSVYDLSVYDAMGIDKNGRYWSTMEAAETALKEMETDND